MDSIPSAQAAIYRIVSSKKYSESLLLEIEVGSLFTLKMEVTLNLNVHTKISIWNNSWSMAVGYFVVKGKICGIIDIDNWIFMLNYRYLIEFTIMLYINNKWRLIRIFFIIILS